MDFGTLAPTREAALARLAAVDAAAYARTRNHLDGAVTGLSPYLTHGLLTVPECLAALNLPPQHKLVYEFGWREYFRHVWSHRGDGIFRSLHEGPLPDAAYDPALPDDLRRGATGVPVVDQAVRQLYATGTLHNHARMWLASYVVHGRKIHWRAGADWLYGHLLDGDLASNHLSWQWVAGTGSHKPYLFDAANVARFAPPAWHSAGSAVDLSYADWDALARSPERLPAGRGEGMDEPPLCAAPAAGAAPAVPPGADLWLAHPWALGEPPPGTTVFAAVITDAHASRPWSPRRWAWVMTRLMALSGGSAWVGSAAQLAAVLAPAARVRTLADPHIGRWLPPQVQARPVPQQFPAVAPVCASFSRWWSRVQR
ncbi:MAG: FAD-binding domain-containing protein [Roseateles sp.]